MLININNNRAQIVMGEYAVVFLLVVAAIVSMTTYFKRSLQAQMRDARNNLVTDVRARTAGSYDGPLYYEYEPYYTDTVTTASSDVNETKTLLPAGTTGIFGKTLDNTRTTDTASETLPPKDIATTEPL